MGRLVARRLALLLPTLLGLLLLAFAFLHLIPGDPVEIMLGETAAPADVIALRHDLGLDRTPLAQLGHFLQRVAHGDLGHSISLRAPVSRVIAARYPATLELAAAALAIAVCVGLPVGILAAVRRGTTFDRLARILSLTGLCLPSVGLGPLLILVFSIWLGWTPVSGRGDASHLILPALTLALGMVGILVRLTRAAMLAALGEDYVRAALARGAPFARAAVRHAFPNALPPILAVLGLQTGALLAGTVITETVFAWPGLGRLVVQAIAARDYPLVQGCVLVIGITYVTVNLLVDIAGAVFDPRLRDDA
jgi:peptide/nickel transport system permease protein